MAKKGVRGVIYLACTVCEAKPRNYTSEKNRRNDQQRLELQKFCSNCRQHTLHRETK